MLLHRITDLISLKDFTSLKGTWALSLKCFDIICLKVELIHQPVRVLVTVWTYSALDLIGLLLQSAPQVSCQERTENNILASLAESDMA